MKKVFYFILVFVITAGCKEVYNPPATLPTIGYLVVEGFINSGNGPTTITLSRTTNLADTTPVVYEHNALVSVESDNNKSYPLYESSNGAYISDSLSLNQNEKYRVHIKTTDGKEYLSDFAAVKYTPPVDSITWKVENGGVQIYVNAHDNQNNTKYYRWKYSETWEFHSPFLQTAFYVRDPVTNIIIDVMGGTTPDTTIYKCWKTQVSKNLILGSSEKLSADKIYLPIRYIEPQADELSVLYYMELTQYALSHDAYLFNQKLKKNTEQLGSIFDPQPSELGGNIHCISKPDEVVIGYVEVSQEQVKKIFIHHSDLPIDWLPHIPCNEVILANKPGNLAGDLTPTHVATYGPYNRVETFYAADPICVDCRTRGTNVKPSFWP